MPWYKVDVNNQTFIGEYHGVDNAVFGALRTLGVRDMQEGVIQVEKMPPLPAGVAKATYTRKLRQMYGC